MKSLYILFLIVVVSGENCDEKGITVYEDLGCTPEIDPDTKCPKKYICTGLEPSDKNCYFRGKAYEDGEGVNSSLTFGHCDIGCFCRAGPISSGFTCAVLDCPEWLGSPLPPGCYRNYSLDSCCSVGEICPPFDDIEKCVVDGKEYREGEKFYPSDSCLRCVCQKGFTGKLEEPFCTRALCGQQLRSLNDIQASCAPFYNTELQSKALCCPDGWICSDGTEVIHGDSKSDDVCQFGNQTLKVGQYFEKASFTDKYDRKFAKIKCDCEIPPLLKCTN